MMVVVEALPNSSIVEIASIPRAGSFILLFSIIWIFIGVVYLRILAHILPIGAGEKGASWQRFISISTLRSIRTLLFIILTFGALLALYLPVSVGLGLIALFSPAFSSFLVAILGGLTFLFFFYLYFVTAGLIVDDLAIWEAIKEAMPSCVVAFGPPSASLLLTTSVVDFSLILRSVAISAP